MNPRQSHTVATINGSQKGETMDINELRAEAFALMATDAEAAVNMLFRAYEEGVAEHREFADASTSTVKFKEAAAATAENLDDSVHEFAEDAMNAVRRAIFEAISQTPAVSVLLYESLGDYVSEVKSFRDYIVDQTRRGMTPDGDTDEEVTPPAISREDLANIKKWVTSAWTMLGEPKLKADSEDPLVAHTKELKSGTALALSNLPRDNSDSSDKKDSETSNGVTVSRLRYSVDGEEIPAGTSLSAVGLWYLSSPDWTVTVSDIKRAVETQTGQDFSEVGEFDAIEVNNHVITRWREKA